MRKSGSSAEDKSAKEVANRRRAAKPDQPSPNWPDDQLGDWAVAQLNASLNTEAESIRLGRETALSRYRAGMALSILRDRLKPQQQWTAWLRERTLKPTVVREAIVRYEKAHADGGEKALAGLTFTEARARWVRSWAEGQLSQEDEDTIRLGLMRAADADRHEEQPAPRTPRGELAPLPGSEGEGPETQGVPPEGISIVHADAREFGWPEVDLIYTDPPYSRLDLYEWLGKMAAERLRPGRLALVYADIFKLPEQVRLLTAAGLRYVATFAISYQPFPRGCPLRGWIESNWRPVVVHSQGKEDKPGGLVYAGVKQAQFAKPLHPWQQAVEPAVEWISRLRRPGDLVADPFAGTGTTAAAVRLVGGLRFVGTELDAGTHGIACRRLAEEGSAA